MKWPFYLDLSLSSLYDYKLFTLHSMQLWLQIKAKMVWLQEDEVACYNDPIDTVMAPPDGRATLTVLMSTHSWLWGSLR